MLISFNFLDFSCVNFNSFFKSKKYNNIKVVENDTLQKKPKIYAKLLTDKSIFGENEKIVLQYYVENKDILPISGIITGEIQGQNIKTLYTFKENINLQPKEKKTLYFSFNAVPPQIMRAYIRIAQNGKFISTHNIAIASEPLKISTQVFEPLDFKTFWEKNFQNLQKKLQSGFKIIKKYRPDMSNAQFYTHEITWFSDAGRKVTGWYRVPTHGQKVKALLQLPALGAYFAKAFTLSENENIGTPSHLAVLSLNLGIGQGESAKKQIMEGIENKETYFYKQVILDCLIGVHFLANESQTFGNEIIVEGMSQGGGLALMLASLDKRIKTCLPDVPFFCGMPYLWTQTYWVKREADLYLKNKQKLNPAFSLTHAQILENLAYYDVANFVKMMPPTTNVYISVGLQDTTCPPLSILAMYQQTRGKKSIKIYPKGEHNGGGVMHRKEKF